MHYNSMIIILSATVSTSHYCPCKLLHAHYNFHKGILIYILYIYIYIILTRILKYTHIYIILTRILKYAYIYISFSPRIFWRLENKSNSVEQIYFNFSFIMPVLVAWTSATSQTRPHPTWDETWRSSVGSFSKIKFSIKFISYFNSPSVSDDSIIN